MKTTLPCSSPSFSRYFPVIFLFMAVLSNHTATAQVYWDVIMLKNAEVIRGTITQNIPDTSVTILAGDSLSRTIAWQEIELITSEIKRAAYTKRTKDPRENINQSRAAHYQGYLGAGVTIPSKEREGALKINFIHGIGFSQAVSLGLGIGLRAELGEDGGMAIPLYGDIRARILRSNVAPVVAMGLGTSIMPHSSSWATGEMVYVEAGISIIKHGKTSFMITLGWERVDVFKEVTESSYGSSSTRLKTHNISGITINLAVGF